MRYYGEALRINHFFRRLFRRGVNRANTIRILCGLVAFQTRTFHRNQIKMQLSNIVAVLVVAICVQFTAARPSDSGNSDASAESGDVPNAAALTSADNNVSNSSLVDFDIITRL